CVAWLLAPDRTHFVPLVGYHIPKDVLGTPLAARLKIDAAVITELRKVKGAIASSDSQAEAWSGMPAAQTVPHRSMLIQPIHWKDELIGGFSVLWLKDVHRFTPDELRLAEGIALQSALAIENSRLYEGVKQQMVELKETQAQLVQSTKLAAIGELAANIAHEINNPLTSVLGFASFLAERLGPGDPMQEELTLIQDEAARARDIVRDLLQFSRQSEFLPAMTDLNVTVEQVVGMVKRQGAVDSITVTEEHAPSLPLVEIDVSRVKQVCLNTLNN